MPKAVRTLLFLLLAATLLAIPAFAAPSDEDDVRQAVDRFSQTWNRHDMDAFGKLFAPDAEFVNVAGDWWKGRQEIQAQHAFSHGTIPADTKGFESLRPYYGIFKTSTMRLTELEVRFLHKDVAVAYANWELLGDARTPNPRHGVFIFVLTREGGSWLIAAAQNTEIDRTVK